MPLSFLQSLIIVVKQKPILQPFGAKKAKAINQELLSTLQATLSYARADVLFLGAYCLGIVVIIPKTGNNMFKMEPIWG